MFVWACACAYAQTDTIRYVHPDGAYNNDGKSWAKAKNRVQDAINDLREYLADNSLTSGSVYIAAGTYVPTESTESSGGSMLNTSFKIYAGIHIYGGFNPADPESKPGDRMMVNGKTVSENWADQSGIGTISGEEIASQWDLQHKTILTGNHTSTPPSYVFDSIRGRYTTAYAASSYHVVWFATNGKYTTSDESLQDHFKPLAYPASIDGCVISSGNASNRSTTTREHTAFGGGVYMVGNSSLRACTIERCNATMRGGGVYADGGGDIDFCYIHTCQATGVGVIGGYGGGVCIDHEGSIGHSQISSCAARCGGGLMICHVSDEYPWTERVAAPVLVPDTMTSNYSPFATACVINNNTANAEGGGIYLAEGGTVNHCTVTANHCSGPDVTYYGRRHGRTGGVYIRNCGMLFNSVFWGNRCDANNDIQFASVRQKSGEDARGFEIFAYHTAFMNHDITDWTGVKKEMVFSLDKQNMPYKGSLGNFCCFFKPTVDPNDWHTSNAEAGIYGAGVMGHVRPVDYPGPRIWHLTSYSALDQKGVQWNASVIDASPWLIHAHTDYGVVSNPYEPVSTLGALVRRPDPLTYELIVPQSTEYGRNPARIPTVFVDPNRKGTYDGSGQFVAQPKEGDSWDVPIKDLGEALSFFRQYLVDDDGDNHHYMIPALDENGMPTGELTRYDYVQILVKEGTLTTVGQGNYLDRNIRTAAVRLESHMRLYGGYPTRLSGTDTKGRNPRNYKTYITANITGVSGEAAYANNSAHVIAMVNCEHTIVDGFTLSDANTHNVDLSLSAHAGGGLLLNNYSTPVAERINMTGNQLRNCVISNCTSPKGAAIYVNGEWPKANGEICYAELMLVNCVIRNNTADYTIDEGGIHDHGIITANGRAYVHAEHCTIVNNVGYPFKAESKDIETDAPVHCGHPEHAEWAPFHGYIRVDNSIIFCNSVETLSDQSTVGDVHDVLSVNADGQDYVFGKYNMFDADLRLHTKDGEGNWQPRGFFKDGYTVPIPDHFLPTGVVSHFTSDISAIPTDSAGRANKCIFTRSNASEETFPTFVNPSRNVGHSPSGDKPLYGGIVAYLPTTTNPCVNAAGRDEYTDYYDFDRSDSIRRDRGGAPDVGAIENTDLPPKGEVIYVTPNGAGKRDGSSWSNAIAGNTVYRLYEAPAAEGDSIDAANNARLVNKSTGDYVSTEDIRYCGGYAMKYIYPVFTDRGRNISRNLEIDNYVGGNNPRLDTTGIDTTSNVVMAVKYNNGTIPSNYVSSLAPDSKYPYGEMSGASRYIYRAQGNYSPLTEDGKGVMVDGSVPANAAEVVTSGRLILTNERRENYVSGLQYAVEKASMANKTAHKDSVQVWVGAGKYTDYKGYVMRDSVSVYGGFPTGKYNAPGMSERRALMSDVVAIPKSKENRDLDAADYETILQISDVNPVSGSGESAVINPAAIKFTDDSATVKVNILNNVTKLNDHNTTHYYKWKPGTDVSTTYMRYPDMWTGSANVFGDRHKIDRSGKTANYITMGNEVFGGITWTAGQKVVYQYFGSPWKKSDMGNNQSWELVYEDRENNINYKSFKFDGARTVLDAEGNVLGTVPRGMELGGVMNTMSVWQTMKNVPVGTYQLQVDLGAYYVNYTDEENTGITFYIIDVNGDTVAEQPMYCNSNRLKRYTFEFYQPSAGDLTVRIMSQPGTKAGDPAEGTFGTNGDDTKDNYRRVSMANVLLFVLDGSGEYVFDYTEERNTEAKIINSTSISEEYVSGTKKNRALLRKRVLQMPDVTSTVYGHGLGDPAANSRGKYSDALSHYERLIKEGRLSNVKAGGKTTVNGRHKDPNYKEYNNVYWDGFTIRHGYLHNMHHIHGGGAGVTMFEGARLVNCIVTDNFVGCRGAKGGGVFCDGCTSTIENCFILNNTLTKGQWVEQSQQQGAGLFLYEGTCFNSLIANNWANGPGAGLGLCVGKFYNNTVAYNTSNNGVGGVRVATGSEPAIFMANTIIFGNSGKALSVTSGSAAVAPFINCYIQSATQLTAGAEGNFLKALASHTEGVTDGNFGQNNTFMNKTNPSAANTPFAADIVNGVYNASNPGAKLANDFALRQVDGIKCINSGEEDFEGAMYKGVREYLQRDNASLNPKDADIKKETFYKNVVGVELPANDVVYAKRIQDCQVDIGAYEFNAAYSIKPDTTTHPGKAIFYVMYESPGGDASSDSPENAACSQKLQLVLDAAGRYKYNLMNEALYNRGYTTVDDNEVPDAFVSQLPNKFWEVEVWMQGDSVGSTKSDTYYASYTPTRSTRHSDPNYQDNTLDYSFIVPRGVVLKGGFDSDFYHYEKDGEVVPAGTAGAVLVDNRDPLTFRTVLSGYITSSTGATGQCYHVVTFTNDLFSPDDEKIIDDGKQLAALTQEKDRAVIDGLFLMDGKANSPDDEDKIGGGCVVTDYAHVRNCVIQNNTADAYGGGLYLKPFGLVSGTIIKNNTASVGGGIYVEAPPESDHMNDSLAHVFSTTICENTGRASAGGVFFDNTYVRINATAIWHNTANDNANVAGNFTRNVDTIPYPLNFCAVESRRLEGQGNIELSPKETEGVRWDRQDPFNLILYYPLEMSSTLARAGFSYKEWDDFRAKFATMDSIDIAGVSRKRWTSDGSERSYAWAEDQLVTKNNDVIDIGARAINKNFEVQVDSKYVMHRLYVIHTELIDSKAARDLQDNPRHDNDTANMYRQMGSCIYNPFHRLDDAFSYIIKARNMDPERYRNTRFEVFIEQGTYYPLHDAYMRQGAVRMNTFLVPEAILIVGGIDSRPADHKYGQEGFVSPFSTVHKIGNGEDVLIPGTEYTIKYETTDNIRLRDDDHRPMRDNNLNSVIEPWELERQTILSGNAVAGEDFTHVYHVVTCHADNRYVGPRPIKYSMMNPNYGLPGHEDEQILAGPLADNEPESWVAENDFSILARTIGFDGLQITGGYANHVDPADTADVFVTRTYFRGGGIYVDGNWWEGADASDPDMTQPSQNNIPIVVENCYFTNNMAGNGGAIYSNGAIYAYGNRFTQNYSQGPMTALDQKYIPWTAGGCIATNAVCDVSNSLFDNNEARRGLYPLTAPSADVIPDADARQGFGGCLSVADRSSMRVVNCHFVKNKAVAYSAIYNFFANNHYSDPDSMQFAFNTIFWGNEVFEIDKLADLDYEVAPPATSETAFKNEYKDSRAGVFHYDADEWAKYERLFEEYDALFKAKQAAGESVFDDDVIAKLNELRAQGNKIEGLYFCSYRKGYGPTGMKPTQDGYLLTEEECAAWKDPRGRKVKIKTDDNDDTVEDYEDLWTHVAGNNNTIINRINTATDGPNFKQPSLVAGIDGYMQNADWLLARMNLTTDQGWGHLKQNVTRGVAYYITKYTGTQHFETPEEALAEAKKVNPAATEEDVYPVSGLPEASFLPAAEQTDTAMYNFLAWRYGRMMSESNAPLPLGDQYYMSYTRSTSDSEMSGNMARISKNPKMGETDVYIDLGIYEYQYVQLDIKGQEIDTVWVATKTKDPIKHDGLSWNTPTTDLQTAIDLLMSSHNNHDKYVCLMGDDEGGTFSPQNVIDNRRAFIISSNTLAPLLPDSALADYDYGINSLTFLGGYSFDVESAKRDPLAHPTVIEMPNAGNINQRNQLFIIEDMTRQMVQANFTGEYVSRDSVVIPIVFDGITFINPYSTKEPDTTAYSSLGGQISKKGGAAIYYRWQRRYEGDATLTPNFNMALHPDSALIDGRKVTLPKLTLSNCIFMDNGARTANNSERSPAVRIDHGGGRTLIVNTLFHSNAGAPIYARTFDVVEEENDLAAVPNDVIIVNSTSALNDGHIRLESDNSEVHNSLIWLDDLSNDTTIQLQMGSDRWDKTDNKNKEGIEGRMTYNAVWGCFQNWGYDNSPGDTYHNHPLSTENNDIRRGPGFLSPHIAATTSEQRRERSFRLNPSVRTHGMADEETYLSRVYFRVYPDTCAETHNKYWRRSNGFKLITFNRVVGELANDSDLAAKPRLSGEHMERGAYECLAVLQRVLYVDPVKPAFSAGDGSNWEHSFGQGQLQNAIDAAAVYTYLYQNEGRETRKAYVFVKGSGESLDQYNLEARDGVSVFGSLPASFYDTAYVDPEEHVFKNSECTRFVNYVRSVVSGVASEKANRTKIHSIHVTGDDFTTGFLLDGFMVTNPAIHPTISSILLDNEMSAVRNCIIVDNHLKDHPIADVRRGLLYNCLFYNDSAATIVKVGANGLVLNNTIVTTDAGVTPLDETAATSGAVQNNIACRIDTAKCFAPYMTTGNPYSLSTFLTDYAPLAFQLHEHSPYINGGTNILPALFNTYTTDNIINFNRDRDILGNPRKISTAVDKGAFETWRVEKNNAQEITALTNKLITQTESVEATDEQRLAAFSEHYGGNQYPHPGSVVYLMDSSAMTMQYTEPNDFHELKNANKVIQLRPGFMLLKPGASFYGNGHEVRLSYLAAEKRFVNQRYSMTAMPFDYNTANITVTHYDEEQETLTYNLSPITFTTFQYNGEARSAKDYCFQTENSSLWLPIDTLNRTATSGYLMDFGATTDTVLRFVSYAPEEGQYIYAEDDEDKSVYLTQYDHRTAGSGSDLDFTRQEDMGWNMKGLPWLVSNYRTDTLLDESNFYRQMYIPHVLYQMDGAGEYITEGDKIYTSRSWDPGSTVSMGNAFLLQTATTQAREEVIFHHPKYLLNEKPARPILRIAGRKRSADILTLMPDSTVSKTVRYDYGRDGVKWLSNDSSAQLYMLDSKRASRISLLGAAPTEVDIPLGVYVPADDTYSFSLPEKEAFDGYSYVWLIDQETSTYTNLLNEDYEMTLEAGQYNDRFAIRIGRQPITNPADGSKYIVFVQNRTLFIRGLEAGDQIAVYAPSGQVIASDIASHYEWTMSLSLQSAFLVRINGTPHKVLNR